MSVTRHTGPIPTQDLARAKSDIREYGCCIVDSALTSQEVAAVRARLELEERRERDAGTASLDEEGMGSGRGYVWGGGKSQRLTCLMNRGPEFVQLVEHPTALEIVEDLIGDECLISSSDSVKLGPYNGACFAHPDQGYIPGPWPDQPILVTAVWMITDFTEDNGGTACLLGSHKRSDIALSPTLIAECTPMAAPAGSLLLYEGRTYHQYRPNLTTEPRYGVFNLYCSFFMRPQENHCLSVNPNVREAASPTLQRLLGFVPAFRGTIGTINGFKGASFFNERE